MIEPEDFGEWEPLDPMGEEWEDQYWDGKDLEEDALHILEEILDDSEWEKF